MSQSAWPSHWPTNWDLCRYLLYQNPQDYNVVAQLWINASDEERSMARSLFYIPDDIKYMDVSMRPQQSVQAFTTGSVVEDLGLPGQWQQNKSSLAQPATQSSSGTGDNVDDLGQLR